MTTQTTRIERAVYDALRDFQQTADWPQLRLAQMRQHLAEHIARDLTLTPGVLPADPDGISVHDLAHALDNSTPYPVELTPTVTGFMAERLLEMLVIGKRDEHLVWQPEKQPELGTQPQPEEPAVSSAVVAPPTDQTALRDRIAEALMQWAEGNNSPKYTSMRRPETVVQNAYSRADAVLAVLPSSGCLTPEYTDGPCHCLSCDPAAHRTDRAAVSREAEAELYVLLRKAGEPRHEAQALIDRHRDEVLHRAELRRLADETPDTTPTTAVDLPTLAAALDGLHTLIATSSRDWQTYRVDAWIWAVLCGWDCEDTDHTETCVHGALEETAARHGWDEATVTKARRYRAAVRAVTETLPAAGARQDGAPDDVVTELTEAEFHDAAGKALARLGLTYAELEDQARRRDFSSAQARSLWVTIGGAAPAGARQDGEAQ